MGVRNASEYAIHPISWIINTRFTLKQEIVWDMGKSANCDTIRFFPFSERIYWLVKDKKTKLHNINNLSDVWRIVPTHKRKDTGHIAVMPEKIVTNILNSINGNLVLDPMNGSGTTTKMAQKLGRNFIGIEISKEYCEIASQRLRQKTLL